MPLTEASAFTNRLTVINQQRPPPAPGPDVNKYTVEAVA
jgi:hypothetical protein